MGPAHALPLPNSATAAMCWSAPGGNGLSNPKKANGTASETSVTAAPREYPPSTILVSGQLAIVDWTRALMSLAPTSIWSSAG